MMTTLLMLLFTALVIQTIRAHVYRKLALQRRTRAEIAEQQLEVFYAPRRAATGQHD